VFVFGGFSMNGFFTTARPGNATTSGNGEPKSVLHAENWKLHKTDGLKKC
jgi:hypothetical protein